MYNILPSLTDSGKNTAFVQFHYCQILKKRNCVMPRTNYVHKETVASNLTQWFRSSQISSLLILYNITLSHSENSSLDWFKLNQITCMYKATESNLPLLNFIRLFSASYSLSGGPWYLQSSHPTHFKYIFLVCFIHFYIVY